MFANTYFKFFCIFVQKYELYTLILSEILNFRNSSESPSLTSQK